MNHKRLRRLLSEWDLALRRKVAKPRPSGVRVILKEGEGKLNLVQGKKFEPFEVLCADFTEIKYANGTRKAYLMAMLDPGSGWVAGWAVEEERRPGVGAQVLGGGQGQPGRVGCRP